MLHESVHRHLCKNRQGWLARSCLVRFQEERMITSWASLIVWLGLSSLLVGTATGPAPENGRLTGSALTQLGQPIPNIFVLIHPNAGGPTTELKVTPEGQFDLRLSPGLYDVLVSSPHFDPVCKLVSSTAAKLPRSRRGLSLTRKARRRLTRKATSRQKSRRGDHLRRGGAPIRIECFSASCDVPCPGSPLAGEAPAPYQPNRTTPERRMHSTLLSPWKTEFLSNASFGLQSS